MSVVVEICNFNDERLIDCIAGIGSQGRLPDRVLIADGGSDAKYVERIKNMLKERNNFSLNIDWRTLPGRPSETRQKSIPLLQEEVTVFLDSDQVPLRGWLDKLVSSIEAG
ncbi:MAG: glycosyltransferase family A protein, partial [Methanomassiliicoccales archaeon]